MSSENIPPTPAAAGQDSTPIFAIPTNMAQPPLSPSRRVNGQPAPGTSHTIPTPSQPILPSATSQESAFLRSLFPDGQVSVAALLSLAAHISPGSNISTGSSPLTASDPPPAPEAGSTQKRKNGSGSSQPRKRRKASSETPVAAASVVGAGPVPVRHRTLCFHIEIVTTLQILADLFSDPSTPLIVPTVPSAAASPPGIKARGAIKTSATDVWYFMRGLDTDAVPTVPPAVGTEPTLKCKPQTKFAGCKLCTYVFESPSVMLCY